MTHGPIPLLTCNECDYLGWVDQYNNDGEVIGQYPECKSKYKSNGCGLTICFFPDEDIVIAPTWCPLRNTWKTWLED